MTARPRQAIRWHRVPNAEWPLLKGALQFRGHQPLAEKLSGYKARSPDNIRSRSLLFVRGIRSRGEPDRPGLRLQRDDRRSRHRWRGRGRLRLGDAKGLIRKPELFVYADGGATFRKHATPGNSRRRNGLPEPASAREFGLGEFVLSGEVGLPVARSHKGPQRPGISSPSPARSETRPADVAKAGGRDRD